MEFSQLTQGDKQFSHFPYIKTYPKGQLVHREADPEQVTQGA